MNAATILALSSFLATTTALAAPCPVGMVPSGVGGCIDRFEFPNRKGGAPLHIASAIPEPSFATRGGTWDAETLCEGEGKRVCSLREWRSACVGSKAAPLVKYLAVSDEQALARREPNETGPRAMAYPSGSFPELAGASGAEDMLGGVEEWVTCPESECRHGWALAGGHAAQSKPPASCARVITAHSPAWHYHTTGHRCCLSVAKVMLFLGNEAAQQKPKSKPTRAARTHRSEDAGIHKLAGHDRSMHERKTQQFFGLRRARDHRLRSVARFIPGLSSRHGLTAAWHVDRSNQRERELRTGELPVGYSKAAGSESSKQSTHIRQRKNGSGNRVGRVAWGQFRNATESPAKRMERRADYRRGDRSTSPENVLAQMGCAEGALRSTTRTGAVCGVRKTGGEGKNSLHPAHKKITQTLGHLLEPPLPTVDEMHEEEEDGARPHPEQLFGVMVQAFTAEIPFVEFPKGERYRDRAADFAQLAADTGFSGHIAGGLDPWIIVAAGYFESRWALRGPDGDCASYKPRRKCRSVGPMQLNKRNAWVGLKLSEKRLRDPAVNISTGYDELVRIRRKCSGPIGIVFTGYTSGIGRGCPTRLNARAVRRCALLAAMLRNIGRLPSGWKCGHEDRRLDEKTRELVAVLH